MSFNLQKRFLLFLIGCMGTRFFLVYLAKNISIDYLPYMGYIALIISFGFMFIFLTGSRKTGTEVMGDKIWWNNLRPLHATLYGLFAYFAITKNNNAWKILLVDVLIGLFSFLTFHYTKGNFSKLF
jgi:hypothetical protein